MDELTGEDGKIDREKLGTLDYNTVMMKSDRDIQACVAAMVARHADPIVILKEMTAVVELMAAPIDSYDESEGSSNESRDTSDDSE